LATPFEADTLGHRGTTGTTRIKIASAAFLVLTIVGCVSAPALAERPGFGLLYYNDEIVRTVVPPAAMPTAGRDNVYAVMNGVEDQLGVAGVAPGDRDHHGGMWAFHSVVWNVPAYLLTSEAAVLTAAAASDVTVTRVPENDFKCPVQP